MTQEEKLNKELEAELAKDTTKVSGDKAQEMKENIMNADEGKPWLGVGVHDVEINGIKLVKSSKGTLGMAFAVSNEDGQNDVTMWLSEGALPYTIQNVSRLIVHNEEGEEAKFNAKEGMTKVETAQMVYKVAQTKLIGKKAFLSVKESETQTYINKAGEEKSSLEKNLLSYKPKVEVQSIAKAQVASGTINDNGEIDLSELPF